MFFCNYGNWKFTQYLHPKATIIKALNAKEKKLSDIFILILIMLLKILSSTLRFLKKFLH